MREGGAVLKRCGPTLPPILVSEGRHERSAGGWWLQILLQTGYLDADEAAPGAHGAETAWTQVVDACFPRPKALSKR